MDMLCITAMIILLKEAQEKMKLGGQSAAPVTAQHSFENSQNFSFFFARTHTHTLPHSHIIWNPRLLREHCCVIVIDKTMYYDIIYIQSTHPWTGEDKMGGGMFVKSY